MPFRLRLSLLLCVALLAGAMAWATPAALSDLEDDALATLQTGEPFATVWRDESRTDGAMDVYSVIDIDSPPEAIWRVMTDCEASVQIVDKMRSCEILETGTGWDIREQALRAGLFRTRNVFRSEYDFPREIRISKAGGDMRVQEGVWTLRPLEDGRTRVSYRATSCPDFPVPSRMLAKAMRRDVPQILTNLRDMAERAN